MKQLSYGFIKKEITKMDIIFTRGENIFSLGNYALVEEDRDASLYSYTFDGSYGDYEVSVRLGEGKPEGKCSCPYPHFGCKHFVAACLDISQRQKRRGELASNGPIPQEYLTPRKSRPSPSKAGKSVQKNKGFPSFPERPIRAYIE